MKHFILILVSTITVFFASAQQRYAINNNLRLADPVPAFSAVITSSGDSAFILEIDNPTGAKLNVWFRHGILGTVVDTIIQDERYRCRYNLSNADEGNYLITVGNGKNKITRKIGVTKTIIEQRRLFLK